MRKKILFLDDDDVRHSYWKRVIGKHHETFHAHDMEEYVSLLNEHRFDVVFLDHDLNDNDHKYTSKLNSRELNGCHAAHILTWLASDDRPKHVHIHSWNQPGAARIASILSEKDIPYSIRAFPRHTYVAEAEERAAKGHIDRMYQGWMQAQRRYFY